MGLDATESIRILQEDLQKQLSKESKTTRKRNAPWMRIPNYPCPNQIIAMRMIAPRGRQDIFRTIEKKKVFLWFKKKVTKHYVLTYLPEEYDFETYNWKLISKEELNTWHGFRF